jgi:excisionase family DNA binding protein
MKDLLSIQEAADLLGVHPETLRRWDREGKLLAVKVGERGDRKYRQEDLMKIILGLNPEEYKGYLIQPYSSGFQRLPDRLVRVASFLVTKDDLVSVFVFTDGGVLAQMANPVKDEELLKEAKEIIHHYIDTKVIKHLEEYPFHYYSNYVLDENAVWWTKTLKKRYG